MKYVYSGGSRMDDAPPEPSLCALLALDAQGGTAEPAAAPEASC